MTEGVRAVLFALEETLVLEHTPDRWQWAWRPQGPVIPERHLRAAIKRGLHGWDRRRWEGLTGAQPPAEESAYRQFLRQTLYEISGHPLPEAETEAVVERFQKAPTPRTAPADVLPALVRLREAGIRLGAVAERPGPYAAETLKRAGLADRVDVIAGSDPSAPWLPSKPAFLAAVAELGAPLAETAFVGQLYWSEVRGSHRAGLAAYLLDRGGWWPRVEERRLTTLTELAPSLLRAAAPPSPRPPEDSPAPS